MMGLSTGFVVGVAVVDVVLVVVDVVLVVVVVDIWVVGAWVVEMSPLQWNSEIKGTNRFGFQEEYIMGFLHIRELKSLWYPTDGFTYPSLV